MSNITRFLCDDETGEITTYSINMETGEPSVQTMPPSNETPRMVDTSKSSRKHIEFPNGYMSKTKKFQTLKASIMAGSNTVSYRMILLIPTLAFFSGFLCVIISILEIFLHVRCHKNNRVLNNPTLYYRSPFHVITSVFCGVCRESDMASKVGQLQDERRYHYDYIRGIAI